MVTPVMDFEQTVKTVERMKKNAEANIAFANQLKANIVALQKSTAHDLVVHNGKVLVKVERKAREGDFVVFEGLNSSYTVNGDFYETYKEDGAICYTATDNGCYMVYGWGDFCETTKVYEVIGNLPQSDVVAVEKKCKHLSANQKRARAIQMAKDFAEDQKTCHTGITAKGNPHEGEIRTFKGIYKRTQGSIGYLSNAEFIRKGNRVTCLLKGVETSKVHFVGRAECHADDVFNEHIGKAVALAKALDIVEQLPPDILNAARPNSFVKGMKVVWVDDFGCANERIVERVENSKVFFTNKSNMPKDRLTIIDDTNADYASMKGGEN